MTMLEIFWVALVIVVVQRLLDKSFQVMDSLYDRFGRQEAQNVAQTSLPSSKVQVSNPIVSQSARVQKLYAVRQGFIPGVYEKWSDCEKQVKGFSGAQFKSFRIRMEVEAYVGRAQLSPGAVMPSSSYKASTSVRG